MGFRFGLDAGGQEAAADVAFEPVGLVDGPAGMDEAGGGIGAGDGLVGGEDAVGEGGKREGGIRALAVGVFAGA